MHSRKPSLVIVEDDADDRLIMQLSFSNSKWNKQVCLFTSGNELLEFLKDLYERQYPALILLDYNMPLLNGAEVLDLLKQNPKYDGIPVALYSTGMNNHLQQRLINKGACACFEKAYAPAQAEELKLKLIELVEQVV